MASLPPGSGRRRPRRGSLERPVNARAYRGTWLLVAVPLLIAAFAVRKANPLPPTTLPPAFNTLAAVELAGTLARAFPDRRPGTNGAIGAAEWFTNQLRQLGFTTQSDYFSAEIPGRGRVSLRNIVAVAPGRSAEAIVVMAHRDNTGVGPGANNNASGTAALVELARAYANTSASGRGTHLSPAHTLIFLSTDGGSFGGLGADRFATHSPYRSRVLGVVNLDSIGGRRRPTLQFAADTPRSPPVSLVETAAERTRDQTPKRARRPSVLGQLLDLAFPFSLYEQAPFVGHGIPAVTLTTAGDRPPSSLSDTPGRLHRRRLGQVGRSAQALLGSLDQGLELTAGTSSYIYLGPRYLPGWSVELVLVAAMLPFLVAVVDLFAFVRRRRIRLLPALRSYRRRLVFWAFVAGVFWLFGLVGIWPGGASVPPDPNSHAVTQWPILGLAGLSAIAGFAWLIARERLIPRRPVALEEEVAGHTAALLVLAVLALLVAAVNPFALLFVLPSIHAWLWLPDLRARSSWLKGLALGAGFAGPVLLLASLAVRFGLGLDVLWYLPELVSLGYVPLPLVLIFVAWLGVAGQLLALTAGRYAPYPSREERGRRGRSRPLGQRLLIRGQRHDASQADRRARASR